VLPAGFLVLALAACEGGGGPVSSGRPSPALPTLSASVPTRSAVPEESDSRTPRLTPTLPTRSAVAAPSSEAPDLPAPTESEAPPVQPPTRTAGAPTPVPTPTPSRTTASTSAAAPTSTSGSTPAPAATPVSSSPAPWVWWLLGLLAVGAAVALVVVAVRRRRTRQAWAARRAAAVGESTWLAHELVPDALSAQSPIARRDRWTASRPRVGALHRNLSELVASAPSDQVGSLDRLRHAVAGLGAAMDAYAATDAGDPERLGAARQAQLQLEDALAREIQPPPAPGPR
jgi:hypothetical protein